MHKSWIPVGLILAAAMTGTTALAPAVAAEPVEAESPEIEAIHAFWSRVDATWKGGDAQRFSELFAENGSFHFVDRDHTLDGRAAILEHFTALFPTIAPEISHRTTVHKIRALAPRARAIDATVEILRADDDADAVPAVLRTFAVFGVMQQSGDDWHIKVLSAYQLPAAAP